MSIKIFPIIVKFLDLHSIEIVSSDDAGSHRKDPRLKNLSRLTGGADTADDPDEAKTGKEAARPRGGRRRSPLHPLASPLTSPHLHPPPPPPPLTPFAPLFFSTVACSLARSRRRRRVRSSGRSYANRGESRRVFVSRTLASRIPRDTHASLFTIPPFRPPALSTNLSISRRNARFRCCSFLHFPERT